MPRLVIQRGVAAGRDQALGAACVVGRHPDADFVLDDDLASRRHFRVSSLSGAWMLEDLGSTNGTFVNGRRTARAPLVDGDRIRVGTTELLFLQKDLLAGPGPARRAAPGGAPVSRQQRRRRRR